MRQLLQHFSLDRDRKKSRLWGCGFLRKEMCDSGNTFGSRLLAVKIAAVNITERTVHWHG